MSFSLRLSLSLSFGLDFGFGFGFCLPQKKTWNHWALRAESWTPNIGQWASSVGRQARGLGLGLGRGLARGFGFGLGFGRGRGRGRGFGRGRGLLGLRRPVLSLASFRV